MTRAQQQIFSDIRKIADSVEKLAKILENEKKISNKN